MDTQEQIKLSAASAVTAFAKNVIQLETVIQSLWDTDQSDSVWIAATVELNNTKGKLAVRPWLTPSTAKNKTAFGLMLPAGDDDVYTDVAHIGNQAVAESTNVLVKLVMQRPIALPVDVVESMYADNPKAISNWKKGMELCKADPDKGRIVVAQVQEKE